MPNMPIREAFKDEAHALQFMLESPWHGVVLTRIASAMEKYQAARHAAAVAGDTGLLQDIELTVRCLKYEASDRVNIKFEYLVVEAFEALHGADAVDELLSHQKSLIAQHQDVEWAAVPACRELVHEFEEAGLSQVPTWGVEAGRADITQQARVRLARHHLLELTRESQTAFTQGNRHMGWRLHQRCQYARRLIGPLSNLECKSKALSTIKDLHGDAVSRPVLAWVKDNTRLQEYEALRDAVQAVRFGPGHIHRAGARFQQ